MGLPWDYHGIAMGLSWDCNGTDMGLLWDCFGGVDWHGEHGSAHGSAMTVLWD